MTNSSLNRDRAVMMSSVRPSLKYSWSGSRLRFSKGHLHLKQFPMQSVEGSAEQPLHQGTAHPRAERNGDVEKEAGEGGSVEGPLANGLDLVYVGE